MEPLFATEGSNAHQSLIARRADAWEAISHRINSSSLGMDWSPLEFDLYQADERTKKVPSISTVYYPGVLAFRADLRAALFPFRCDGMELLPIMVADEPWLLLNCLKSVNQFDEAKSHVMRGLTGDIFMVLKLHVTDPAAQGIEMFTLAGSNHSQLFVRSSFKARVESLRLKGITFRAIGDAL